MQFKPRAKIFLSLLVTTYSAAWVFAQAQPRANGAALGSTTGAGVVSATRTTTNATADETAPSDVTNMDPMDPTRDSRMGSDATMGDRRDRRARGPASATVTPETVTPETVPNTTY